MCVYDDAVVGRTAIPGKRRIHAYLRDYDVSLTVPADHVVAGTGMVKISKKS